MSEHNTAQPKRDMKAAPAQTPTRQSKVAGVAVADTSEAASKGLMEVLTFMHRLSAFEKRSSQVNLLVR